MRERRGLKPTLARRLTSPNETKRRPFARVTDLPARGRFARPLAATMLRGGEPTGSTLCRRRIRSFSLYHGNRGRAIAIIDLLLAFTLIVGIDGRSESTAVVFFQQDALVIKGIGGFLTVIGLFCLKRNERSANNLPSLGRQFRLARLRSRMERLVAKVRLSFSVGSYSVRAIAGSTCRERRPLQQLRRSIPGRLTQNKRHKPTWPS